MSFQDLRAIALFDGLSDSQLLELMTVGEELDFNPGEELFGEARPADYWWVLLGGDHQSGAPGRSGGVSGQRFGFARHVGRGFPSVGGSRSVFGDG